MSNKNWKIEGLPRGSALLVVKRGPNAGSPVSCWIGPSHPPAGMPTATSSSTTSPSASTTPSFGGRTRKFQVVDVDSLDGTYVNRELVDSAVLANGDEIQMGKFRLVFLTAPTTA